ncbi:cytidylyltransferase domain-containing protein [Pseudomonas lini]
MIVRSIRTALESNLFDQVIVSTDDEEIAEVARAGGAQVPFMRPAALADDFTGTAAVIVHALKQLPPFDYACCVYATAPLLQAHYLRQGHELLVQHPDKSFAFFSHRFWLPGTTGLDPRRAGRLDLALPGISRDPFPGLARSFSRCRSVLLGGRSEAWLRGDVLFSPASLPVILPRHLVQDIDTLEDWTRAEYLYAALKAGGELQ